MKNLEIPVFCAVCIKRFQDACPHKHTFMTGGLHFSEGDMWDDLHCICLDCGTNLDRLPFNKSIDSNSEIPF